MSLIKDFNDRQWLSDPLVTGDSSSNIAFNDANQGSIIMHAGDQEMIRIGPDGFWVRGAKVEQDDKEAQNVYEAFRHWMTWVALTNK